MLETSHYYSIELENSIKGTTYSLVAQWKEILRSFTSSSSKNGKQSEEEDEDDETSSKVTCKLPILTLDGEEMEERRKKKRV